jgi:hypothetical protein
MNLNVSLLLLQFKKTIILPAALLFATVGYAQPTDIRFTEDVTQLYRLICQNLKLPDSVTQKGFGETIYFELSFNRYNQPDSARVFHSKQYIPSVYLEKIKDSILLRWRPVSPMPPAIILPVYISFFKPGNSSSAQQYLNPAGLPPIESGLYTNHKWVLPAKRIINGRLIRIHCNMNFPVFPVDTY